MVATREHGTHSCYSSGCRCEPCREAHRVYGRENYRRRMRELYPGWTPELRVRVAKHGTRSKYSLGCRCDHCREANRLFRRAQNYSTGYCSPKVETERVRPLVSCLISFGLERRRIALAAGVSPTTLRLKRPTIQRASAEAIEKLHWGLRREHVPFRRHCRCDPELVVLESFEEAS